jgi:hypothetical protein
VGGEVCQTNQNLHARHGVRSRQGFIDCLVHYARACLRQGLGGKIEAPFPCPLAPQPCCC